MREQIIKVRCIFLFFLITIVFGLLAKMPLQAVSSGMLQSVSIEDIKVLKISPQDKRAVVMTPDGKMNIIKPGDAIGESGKVIEITKGRVVIEEYTERGVEKVIIRIENGDQKIERIKKIE